MELLQDQPSACVCPKCRIRHSCVLGPLLNGTYKGVCHACQASFEFQVPVSAVSISVNGNPFSITEEQGRHQTLIDFLHQSLQLPATHAMCHQGRCGTCVVTASYFDTSLNQMKTIAVNACLQPVMACNGWQIETSEGIGNRKTGYHPIQRRLAEYNGTQCGYCSPGFVMNMYSMLKANPHLSKQEIEDSFEGNLCRCTGYRSILDAMKSLAVDGASPFPDIEDSSARGCCRFVSGMRVDDKARKCNESSCAKMADRSNEPITVPLYITTWQRPTDLKQLYDVINSLSGKNIRLVAGDTGKGLFKPEQQCDIYIDVRSLKELSLYLIGEDAVRLGATVTLADMIEIFEEAARSHQTFKYLQVMAEHIRKVANTPIRNVATWAGNLMLKWRHRDYVSDMCVVMATAGVTLHIGNGGGDITIDDFLATDMTSKVIEGVTFHPMTSSEYYVKTWKIMPQSQGSLAMVSCGMCFKLDDTDDFRVNARPRIVFGGINGTMIHAEKTESFLDGKQLSNETDVKGALSILELELVPNEALPPQASAAYRKNLAISLFYKFVVSVLGDRLPPHLRLGGQDMNRCISTGSQLYKTQTETWPVGQPMAKISANLQVSGEADYVETMAPFDGELHAHFVLSTIGNGEIDTIDASEALAMPGVVRVLTHTDLPPGAVNSYVVFPSLLYSEPQEALCSGTVLYHGQPLALVVAETRTAAEAAGARVKVTYRDVKPPIITIEDAIAKKSYHGASDHHKAGDAEGAIASSTHKVEGRVTLGEQYAFHMETLIARCLPTDDGIEAWAATQCPANTQASIAQVLGISQNRVNVQTKRLGGGFGGKIHNNELASCMCALAAHLTGRPVLMHLSLGTTLQVSGRRAGYIIEYEAGFDGNGQLNGISCMYYCNQGCTTNTSTVPFLHVFADSPGLEASYLNETIMEHIAEHLGKDPLEVKVINFYNKGDVTPLSETNLPHYDMKELVEVLEHSSEISTRKQQASLFNESNRWRKKGLSVVPIYHPIIWSIFKFNVIVTIYSRDGSVAVCHGGVEMGQGLNTKVMQVIAKELGIPVSMVTTRPTDTLGGVNSTITGASITSELCCLGAIEACKELKGRIAPVQAQMPDRSWPEVITKCYEEKIDLQARCWVAPDSPHITKYLVGSVACTEVEIDVLTGQHIIQRVDIVYDCGDSINPDIDVGQIEGAFVMGLGYFLTEEVKYDASTGRNLTTDIWTYKVPTTKDIPVDFRVELLREGHNPVGVLGSKATGEPSILLSSSIVFAIKQAIQAARRDSGVSAHFDLDCPVTAEKIHSLCLPGLSSYRLK